MVPKSRLVSASSTGSGTTGSLFAQIDDSDHHYKGESADTSSIRDNSRTNSRSNDIRKYMNYRGGYKMNQMNHNSNRDNSNTVLYASAIDSSTSSILSQAKSTASNTATNSLRDKFVETLVMIGKFIPLFNPTILGGLLSGSLHAISGPDHLAAILPASVGSKASLGLRIGATWGLGHGLTCSLLGLSAYFLKDRINLGSSLVSKLSIFAESAVGISLLLIGSIGIREVLFDDDSNTDGHGDGKEVSVSKLTSYKAIFVNGCIHGFSLDGAPSFAPALLTNSWASACAFLFAYCLGTMSAMSVTAGAVGEASLRLGETFGSNKLPQRLSLISSIIAIVIGGYILIAANL